MRIVFPFYKLVLAFLLIFSCCFSLSAQIPSNVIGANPLSLKWDQIHTDKVQVIFPRGLDAAGQRVANVIHYLWDNNTASIGDKKQKVTILLQNQTTIPNGLVTVGPFRSEFNLTPDQFNNTTDWLDILTIHEYRHIQQFGQTNQGITKLVKDIFGSWAWGGMFGLALPRWYLEGDATGMETALTNSGRGRLPSFDMELKSLFAEDIAYNYEKAAAGSFKDFVPNWYRLGYHMTTYARKEYGANIWAEVVDDASKYKGLFVPFSKGLEKRTGMSTADLYTETMKDLKEDWSQNKKSATTTSGTLINTAQKKTVTDYSNPRYFNNDRLVVAKRAFNQIPAFVTFEKTGKENKITEPGIVYDPLSSTLSMQSGLMCWAELGYDLRWSNKNYSIIKTYDLNTKRKNKITSKSKYFSPALSYDGQRIVVVEANEQMEYKLVILNASNGSIMQELENPNNVFHSFPNWMEDGQHIVVVAQQGESNTLLRINVENGNVEELTIPSNQQITHPYGQGEYVYFSGTYTGVNNIFAVKIADKTLYQLTSSPLGAFHPAISPNGEKLAYSEFSARGYNVVEVNLKEALWKVYDQEKPKALPYMQVLEEQEGGSIFEKVGNEKFNVQKYNKLSGIVNPHSLLPFLEPPTFGLQVLSDNKFGTLSANADAYYNVNEREWTFVAGATYAELYPFINASFVHANRSANIYNFTPTNDSTIINTIYTEEWRENRISGGLALPLNLTSGNFFNRLTLRADYTRINIDVDGNFDLQNNFRDTLTLSGGNINRLDFIFEEPLRNTNLDALDLRMVFRSFRRTALQHINPRLGLNIDLRYRTTFGNDIYQGDVFLARGDLFLPGLG
ncbi:MAG: hypothetical protein AAFO07_18930, partial [Bacteroidota bacterium]